MRTAEERVHVMFDQVVKEARQGFRVALGMDLSIFAVGILLLVASAGWALLNDDMGSWVGAGASGGAGVLGILYTTFVAKPRKQVKASVDHLMYVKVLFLGYLRSLHQVDQDLALMDARRGIAMYNKVNVPVLGLVENMSYHICKSCSHREHIFGHGGAKTAAGELGVDFLGEIPLEMTIQESADLGKPISLSLPESQSAIQYKSIAAQVVAKLRLIESEQDGPPKLKVTNKLQKKANMAPADLLAMIEKYISQHISIPEWNMLHVILTALSVIQVITSYGGEASGKANMGYSKFANPKAKSTVPSKFGMFIIYVGAMLVNLVCLSGMLFSDHEIHNSRQVLVAICLSVHFVKRELEVLFLHRFSGVTELPVALMISVFYTLGSVQIEYFVSTVSESYYGANPSSLPVGVVLFVTGTLGNLYHHSLLAGLRKPNEKKYVKPEGGLFSLVTCPHYFFELMAWYGISILSLQLNVFLNGFAMTSYLLGRSVATSRWYREKMEDYPQKMKCIIPFVF
eukprot:gene2655-3423_t